MPARGAEPTRSAGASACPGRLIPPGHSSVPCLEVPACPDVAKVDDFSVIAAPDNSTQIGHREVQDLHALQASSHRLATAWCVVLTACPRIVSMSHHTVQWRLCHSGPLRSVSLFGVTENMQHVTVVRAHMLLEVPSITTQRCGSRVCAHTHTSPTSTDPHPPTTSTTTTTPTHTHSLTLTLPGRDRVTARQSQCATRSMHLFGFAGCSKARRSLPRLRPT